MFLANIVQIILFLLIFTESLGPSHAKFVCENGRVVDRSQRCDGRKDCKDGSDERQCSACVGDAFHCNQTQECFPHNFKCNGQEDCPDGSDEQNCPCPDPENQFQCGYGDCIDKAGRCNAVTNCFDGSDERNCSACYEISGFPKPFHCKPTLQCLSHDLVCNKQIDCLDGSDEADCPPNWLWWLLGVLVSVIPVCFTLYALYVIYKAGLLLPVVETFFSCGKICSHSRLVSLFKPGPGRSGSNGANQVMSEDTMSEENSENDNPSEDEQVPLLRDPSAAGKSNSGTTKKETFSARDVQVPSDLTKKHDKESDSETTDDEDKDDYSGSVRGAQLELRLRRTFKPLRFPTTSRRTKTRFGSSSWDSDNGSDDKSTLDGIVVINRQAITNTLEFLKTLKTKLPSEQKTKTEDDVLDVDLESVEEPTEQREKAARSGMEMDVKVFYEHLKAATYYPNDHASRITEDQFLYAVKSCKHAFPTLNQYNHFVTGLDSAGITTKIEAAMFLAHVLHESDGLNQKQGNGGPYKSNPDWNPDNEVAGKYSGRGYIPLTYESNYRAASEWLGFGDLLLRKPKLVARKELLAWGVSFYIWVVNVQPKLGRNKLQFGRTTTALYGKLDKGKAQERFETYERILTDFECSGKPMM